MAESKYPANAVPIPGTAFFPSTSPGLSPDESPDQEALAALLGDLDGLTQDQLEYIRALAQEKLDSIRFGDGGRLVG